MNIIFVGHKNEINGTIVDILDDQPGYTIEIFTPDGVEKKADHINQEKSDLLILDLSGYNRKPTEIIADFKQMLLSKAILAIHVYTSIHLIKPLLEAGADGYLPSTTTENEILTAINNISTGQKYPDL